MSLENNQELHKIKENLINGMIEYCESGDVDYKKKHVKKCGKILDAFLKKISKAQGRESAMIVVKETVGELNKLSEKTEELIETDQREQICEFISKAGAILGFNTEQEDITEEWRKW
jgi:hypothetical protein